MQEKQTFMKMSKKTTNSGLDNDEVAFEQFIQTIERRTRG